LSAKRLPVSIFANTTRHSMHLISHLRSIPACRRLFCTEVE
jgi:hypothetical protein